MISTSLANNIQESSSIHNEEPSTLIRLQRYFKFLRISVFIIVLIMIHAWLENSLAAILITHLTGDGLQLPKAASIVNVQDGISAFLLLLVAWLSNKPKFGSFLTLLLTNTFYLSGLVLIYIVARKQEQDTSSLFIAAAFIAVGRSGRDISLKQFLADQCEIEWSVYDDDDKNEKKKIESRRQIHWRIAYVLGVIISLCVSWIDNDMDWARLSKMSAIALAIGFVFFLAGIPFYHDLKELYENINESSAWRVLLAAIWKRHLQKPPRDESSSPAAAFENRHEYMNMALSWVNKAAIIEPSLSIEKQVRRRRLYTIEDVRDVKNLLSLIPLWTTFLVYGLLLATANVFFYEQVSYMNPQVGFITNIPVALFTVIMSSTKFLVSYICEKWFPSYTERERPRRHVMLLRIGLGLAIAPLCCVVAWRVENYRLETYVKSDVDVGVVWLIPQFMLVGVLDGLVSDGMERFFDANVSKSFKKYGPSFTQFAPNIGHFISLALVLNLRSLFGDNLDMSSLGLYYAILSYICLFNFMLYCFVATHFVKRQEGENYPRDEEEGDNEQEGRECQEMEEIQNGETINLDDVGNHEQEGETYAQDEDIAVDQWMEELQNVESINLDGARNHEEEGESYAQDEGGNGQEIEEYQNTADINLDDARNYERERWGEGQEREVVENVESYAQDGEREDQKMHEHLYATNINPDDVDDVQDRGREDQMMAELQNNVDINPDDGGNQEQKEELYTQDEEVREDDLQNEEQINLDDAGNHEKG